jgi:lipoprotein-releasing system permease protein
VGVLAIIGVAIGVAALIGGASITAGFEKAFQDKLLGVTSHIFARPHSSARYDVSEMETAIKREVDEVIGVSPTTYHKAIFVGPGGTVGGFIKSIDPQRVKKVLKLESYLIAGSLDQLDPYKHLASTNLTQQSQATPVIIGRQLARRLKAQPNQLITALSGESNQEQFFKADKTSGWRGDKRGPSNMLFKVVGIFEAGYDDYDSHFAFLHFSEAERIFGVSQSVQGFEVSVKTPKKATELAPRVASAMKWSLGDPLDWSIALVKDPLKATRIAQRSSDHFEAHGWYEQNILIYKTLVYQRFAILIVLSVMLILASCNVSSMMMMMTLERTPEIAILKTMGATSVHIKRIFQAEGLGIAVVGSLIGTMIGFVFCEWILGRGVSLDPKVYGISRFPVEFRWEDYILAIVGSVCILWIAVTIPARRGSNLPPSEGLRGDQLDLPPS